MKTDGKNPVSIRPFFYIYPVFWLIRKRGGKVRKTGQETGQVYPGAGREMREEVSRPYLRDPVFLLGYAVFYSVFNIYGISPINKARKLQFPILQPSPTTRHINSNPNFPKSQSLAAAAGLPLACDDDASSPPCLRRPACPTCAAAGCMCSATAWHLRASVQEPRRQGCRARMLVMQMVEVMIG